MLKARCPSCGKSAWFDEIDAGLPVVCLACGARYNAPQALPAAARTAGASGESGGPTPFRAPRVGRTFWVATALGALAAVVALVLILRGRPDPVDRDTVRALASQAEAYAAEGRLADAHRKYHELETLVGHRTIQDPEVRRAVEEAMADKDLVYARLLSDAEKQRQAAATAPAVASAIATQPTSLPSSTGPSDPSPADAALVSTKEHVAPAEGATRPIAPSPAAVTQPVAVASAQPRPAAA